MLIVPGRQEQLISETTAVAGITVVEGSIRADGILVSLFVSSLTSGSLLVEVFTLTDEGKELRLFAFPAQTNATLDLLLRESLSMQRFRITATYSGACSYEVYVKATTGASLTTDGSSAPITIEPNGPVRTIYNTALSVATGTTVDLLTYTVPIGKTAYLLLTDVSGTNIATYDIFLNGIQIARKRTYFGGPISEVFLFGETLASAVPIAASTQVKVRVNNYRPTVADFEARLQLIEV